MTVVVGCWEVDCIFVVYADVAGNVDLECQITVECFVVLRK